MCRLRTASLPQPSRAARFCFTAPAVSLRAQRGNPVNKAARSAQNFYRGGAFAETDELCTLNSEL